MKFVVICAGAHEDVVRTCETAWDALNEAMAMSGRRRGVATISDEAGYEYSIDDFRRRFVGTTRHMAPPSRIEKQDVRRDMPRQTALRSHGR
jgi:hypothetical protein